MNQRKNSQSVIAEMLKQTLIALRRVRAQVAVSQMRAAAQARGIDGMTKSEIESEIQLARRGRKKQKSVKK